MELIVSEKKNEIPLVSVVVLCYNQAKYVEETLDSILNQTYSNIQLIIIDDCSQKDNSVEVIDTWINENSVDCIFIKHAQNQGICKSLNEAFSYVKGKYFQGIASDDVMLPDKIEKHVNILEKSSSEDALVFSDAYLMNEKSELYQNKFIAFHKTYLSLESGNFYLDLLVHNYIPAMSILYKVDQLKLTGGWDESLNYEDYDMLLRIAKNYNFIFDNNATVKYRFHESNLHKTITNWEEQNFKILMKHSDVDGVNEKLKFVLLNMYLSKNKSIKYFSGLYFSKETASDFSLFCIKHAIPVRIFKIRRFISKFIRKNSRIN